MDDFVPPYNFIISSIPRSCAGTLALRDHARPMLNTSDFPLNWYRSPSFVCAYRFHWCPRVEVPSKNSRSPWSIRLGSGHPRRAPDPPCLRRSAGREIRLSARFRRPFHDDGNLSPIETSAGCLHPPPHLPRTFCLGPARDCVTVVERGPPVARPEFPVAAAAAVYLELIRGTQAGGFEYQSPGWAFDLRSPVNSPKLSTLRNNLSFLRRMNVMYYAATMCCQNIWIFQWFLSVSKMETANPATPKKVCVFWYLWVLLINLDTRTINEANSVINNEIQIYLSIC